jgi:predicted HTH transcriptional regulator
VPGNAGKRLASRDEMRRMFQATRTLYVDESVLVGSGPADVDWAVFQGFLQQGYGLDLPAEDRPEQMRLLRNLKGMVGDELTVAGALFFLAGNRNAWRPRHALISPTLPAGSWVR